MQTLEELPVDENEFSQFVGQDGRLAVQLTACARQGERERFVPLHTVATRIQVECRSWTATIEAYEYTERVFAFGRHVLQMVWVTYVGDAELVVAHCESEDLFADLNWESQERRLVGVALCTAGRQFDFRMGTAAHTFGPDVAV